MISPTQSDESIANRYYKRFTWSDQRVFKGYFISAANCILLKYSGGQVSGVSPGGAAA